MSIFPNYERDDRPWGFWERFVTNEKATVKHLHINPGKRTSLQTHAHRDEYWHFYEGSATIQIGDETREVHAGDEAVVRAGQVHRLTTGSEGVSFLEVMFGDYDEKDINRIEDDFGRAPLEKGPNTAATPERDSLTGRA